MNPALPALADELDAASLDAAFEQGMEMHRQGRLEEAEQICQRILQQDVDDTATRCLLALIALQTKRPALALRLTEQAIALDAEYPEAHHAHGLTLRQLQRPEAAVASFDRAIALRPDYAEACYHRGLALQQLRRAEEATASYDAAIALGADSAAVHYWRGHALMALRRWEDAVAAFDDAVARQAGFAEALASRAQANAALGRFAAALADYDQAIELQPHDPALHDNRGLALHALGQFGEAVASYGRAIALRPDDAPAYHNRGLALHAQQRFAEAVANYDMAIALQPDQADTYNNRGIALRALKRTEHALKDYDRALALRPDYAEACNNRGNALRELQRPHDAQASFDRALALRPEYPEAHNNRGIILYEMARSEAAIACFEQAIALRPDYAEAYCNRASVLQALQRAGEAIPSYEAALRLEPDYAVAHENYGMCLLQLGEFSRGWREYEWRWKASLVSRYRREFPRRLWLGEQPIAGATLLLQAEQGLGDTLQFCRFARQLAEQGARVVLQVQPPLVRLLDSLAAGKVIAFGDPVPEFDWHCPLLSLPLALRTSLDTIPAYGAYLRADPVAAAMWRRRLAELPGRRVGLVWAGAVRRISPDAMATDRRRSMTLERFASLAAVPNVSFVSLQKGPPSEQARSGSAALQLFDATDELDDFADTAALVEALDLVITVDTSVAHLAGALGRPVWILNRFDSCWRWLLDRSDSPWYPTARLFRQPAPGDWDSVVSEVRAALSDWAGVN